MGKDSGCGTRVLVDIGRFEKNQLSTNAFDRFPLKWQVKPSAPLLRREKIAARSKTGFVTGELILNKLTRWKGSQRQLASGVKCSNRERLYVIFKEI